MPGLSGRDTGVWRGTRPGLKVLFMSRYAGMAEYEREARHDGWLEKPFRAEVLVGGGFGRASPRE